MAKYWRESYDCTRHRDPMTETVPPKQSRDPKLDPQDVYFVKVVGFTFEFHSLEQMRIALGYFSQKVRPSSRIPNFPSDEILHYEAQRWYDRLPMKLLRESSRLQIVKALSAALAMFSGERTNPSPGV
jgi:hypothetical protein